MVMRLHPHDSLCYLESANPSEIIFIAVTDCSHGAGGAREAGDVEATPIGE